MLAIGALWLLFAAFRACPPGAFDPLPAIAEPRQMTTPDDECSRFCDRGWRTHILQGGRDFCICTDGRRGYAN